MISIKYEVQKTRQNIPVRYYSDRESYQEDDIDTGYLLGCKICDAIDAVLKALEDEDQMKKEVLRKIRDHVGGKIE